MEKNIFSKIYMWVFVGLLITFITSYSVSTSYEALNLIFGSKLYWIIMLAEIVVAIVLPVRLHKMNKTTAILLYLFYTFLTGLTFASIFILFSIASIIYVFLITSIVFLVFALIGRFTNIDLTKFGTFLFMTLIGIIILELINLFVMNGTLDMVLCVIGLIVFFGYIAYDVQKIKRLDSYGMDENKLAVYGAFNLYLDFINVFIRLLQIFGKSRD